MTYLRFSALTSFLVMSAVLLSFGLGWALALTVYAIFSMSVVDEYFGNTRRSTAGAKAFILNLFLYLSLPLLIILTMILATFLSHGDPFGVIALGNRVGLDIAASRAEVGPVQIGAGVFFIGLLYGTAGINVAHELFHRTQSVFDVVVGRWLLAFSWDTTFAIEHVYGHHRHIGTLQDPATARRFESLPAFWVRSTFGQIVNAFQYEAGRLARRNHHWLNWRNKALRGQLMSIVIGLVWYYAAGLTGVAAFLVAAVIGKLMLESINYIEHYGLVRVEGTKVAARHSWDCYRIISNALLYNLPRHSAHHLNASLKYWELQINRDVPMMPMGYMSMILVALVPPLWRRTIHPLLKAWDEELASDEERQLISERNWQIV